MESKSTTGPTAAVPPVGNGRVIGDAPWDAPPATPGKNKPKAAKCASHERTEPLNFRVAAEFRRAFKRAAAAQDCKKVELLERIFTEWSARNPT
jgi:hypothetical protein